MIYVNSKVDCSWFLLPPLLSIVDYSRGAPNCFFLHQFHGPNLLFLPLDCLTQKYFTRTVPLHLGTKEGSSRSYRPHGEAMP